MKYEKLLISGGVTVNNAFMEKQIVDEINNNYWDAHCTVCMPCTPAWYPEQHKLVEE